MTNPEFDRRDEPGGNIPRWADDASTKPAREGHKTRRPTDTVFLALLLLFVAGWIAAIGYGISRLLHWAGLL